MYARTKRKKKTKARRITHAQTFKNGTTLLKTRFNIVVASLNVICAEINFFMLNGESL